MNWFDFRYPGEEAWDASSLFCPCHKTAAQEFALSEHSEDCRFSGDDSQTVTVEVQQREDEDESTIRTFNVVLEPKVVATAYEVPKPKDQLDHALDLYRGIEAQQVGATFEECLAFVQAVDGEADRRRLKDWLKKPRPIRSHDGDLAIVADVAEQLAHFDASLAGEEVQS